MSTRILIVEDETALRETLAYNLAKEGYKVASSSDDAKGRKVWPISMLFTLLL